MRVVPLLVFLLAVAASGRADPLYRLDVSAPEARGEVVQNIPLVHVRGQALRGGTLVSDVVIAIDISESAFMPSGRDVDGDGVTGRMAPRGIRRADGSRRRTRAWTTDSGDTLFESARALAREVIRGLPAERTRVALLTFSDGVRVRRRLGSPSEALRTLERLRPPTSPGGTDIARAIRIGRSVLGRDEDRAKLMLIFSDGQPTRPRPGGPAIDATLHAARKAAGVGVEIHAVALGAEPAVGRAVFAELARLGGGRYARAPEPGPLLAALPLEHSASLVDVDIANLTTGADARAVRLFPDGSFDGYVALVPGRNQLAVRARSDDGREVGAFRTVHFRPSPEPTEGDAALRSELRDRAVHIGLADRARRPRAVERSLEIESAGD